MIDSLGPAAAELFGRAHIAVVEDGRPFSEAMFDVRAEFGACAALLRDASVDLADTAPLMMLFDLIPDADDSRWDRTVVAAVVVQSLLVGADDGERRFWSEAFSARLDVLADDEWAAAVDGVVANHAGSLLSLRIMRRLVDHCPSRVSRGTLDTCCRTLAAAAITRGDVGEAVWAVGRAASPFAIAGSFVETRGDTEDRVAIRSLYREISRLHQTDVAHPILTSAHWMMLAEPDRAESLLPDAVSEARARPDSDVAWVAVLVAVLVSRQEVAEALAREIQTFLTRRQSLLRPGGDVPPVVAWVLSRGIADPERRATVLQRCLRGDRDLGGLESRLWFDLAAAENECGRTDSADEARRLAAGRRFIGVDDRIGFSPVYGQMETLLAMVAVTDAELDAARNAHLGRNDR